MIINSLTSVGPGCQLNYKQAFSFQSLLESDEGLRSCSMFGVSWFCMSQIPTSRPDSCVLITIHPSLGGTIAAERGGQSLSPELRFVSKPWPCLARNARGIDVGIKWLFLATRMSCKHSSAFCNFALGLGLCVPAHEVFTGEKLKLRCPCGPAGLSSHGLCNTTGHGFI